MIARGAGDSGALFSDCMRYRYRLWRRWDGQKPVATFIMLNPSTADENEDDPTVARCRKFAERWGCGTLRVLNIFALRATDPRELYRHADPVGPDNDIHIRHATHDAEGWLTVAAWGVHGEFKNRGAEVKRMVLAREVPLLVLGLTKGGHPRHPLYLRGDLKPQRWEAP